MPKAPEPSSTCQKTTKSLPRISPKSYCYNAVPNRFLAHFSTSRTNGPRLLSRAKAGTHSAFGEGSHTAACTPKQGPSGRGVVSLPSERITRFGNPAWPRGRTANCAAFGSWPGALSKNAEGLRDSDALIRVAVPRRRGPAGLRDLFRFCRNCGLYALRSGSFRVCETWEVSLPSACSVCCRNAGRPLVKKANLPFSGVAEHHSLLGPFFANI